MARSRGGGTLKLYAIALIILVGGGGAAGYLYLKKTQLDPAREATERLDRSKKEAQRAKDLFFRGDYDASFKAADESILAQPEETEGYFWAARAHMRIYQEGHYYPAPWKVGGVIRFTPPVPDDLETLKHGGEVVKQMKEVEIASPASMGEWVKVCAEGMLAFMAERYDKAEAKLAETVKAPDADPEIHIHLATARIMQKKFEEAADGLEPVLPKLGSYIDARITWAKAMLGVGLEKHRGGEDPTEVYRRSLGYLEGISGDRAAAARSEILTAWGDYLSDRGMGKAEILDRYEESAKQGDKRSAAEAKVAHARWLIEHGRPLEAKELLHDALRTLDAAVLKDVLDINLLVRRALAMTVYTEYLVAAGERPTAAEKAAPVLQELETAAGTAQATDADRLALGAFKARIAWTLATELAGRNDAARSLEKLAAMNPSDPWPVLEAARLHSRTGEIASREGKNSAEAYASAIANASQALQIRSDILEARVLRGGAYVGLAIAGQRRGEDPDQPLKRADEDFAAALAVNPKEAVIHRLKGLGEAARAAYLADRGEDPSAAVEAAIAAFGEALRIQADWAEVYLDRARARFALGRGQEAAGQDPGSAFDIADQDLTIALQHRGNFPDARVLRAEVRIARGLRMRREGKNPAGVFEQASADAAEALRLKPDFADGFKLRGAAAMYLGELDAVSGKDPAPRFESALKDLDQSIQRGGSDPEAFLYAGRTRFLSAAFKNGHGGDPSEDLSAGLGLLDKALELHPKMTEAFLVRGSAKTLAAELARRKGAEGGTLAREAVSDFDSASHLRAGEIRSLVGRGAARLELALQARQGGGDVSESIESALADCDQALGMDGKHPVGLALRAAVRAESADAALRTGGDPKPEAAASIADADAALRIDSKSEQALLARSHAHRVLGWLAGLQKARDLTAFQRAAEDALAAARVNPGSAAARREAAEAYLAWSSLLEWRTDSGVAQYQSALKTVEEGLGISAGDQDLLRLKAWALSLEANHDRRIGAMPAKKYAAALEAADAAVQANPAAAGPLYVRAEVLLGWVLWHRLQSEQEPMKEKHARGMEDLQKAMDLNPGDPLPLVARSRYYKEISAAAAARADAEKVAARSKWFRTLVE